MTHEIVLLDGCKGFAPGQALYSVLDHMAGIVGTIHSDKTAGQVDMEGYNVARTLIGQSFNSQRGQVEMEALIGNIVKHPFIQGCGNDAKVIMLIPEDLYAHNEGRPTNWVHGGHFHHNGRDIVVISTHRFYNAGVFDPIHFKYVMTHELGHMYGATPKDRKNTYELLGVHCSNDCIMQQSREGDGAKRRAHELHKNNTTFCHDCRTEMARLHRRPR